MSIFQERRDKLKRLVKKSGADAILVTYVPNVAYLTGFTGDSSYLLVSDDRTLVFSDARYTTQLAEECPDLEAEIRGPGTTMVQLLGRALPGKFARIAIEAASMNVALHERLTAEFSQIEFVSSTGLVEELRMIKDKDELAAIRRAVYIAERAFGVAKAVLRPDHTEKQIADEIEHQVRLFDGTCTSFPSIIAAGPRAALPHAGATRARLGDQEFVLCDWGAREDLYVSDMTRVLVFGKVSAKLAKIHDVVHRAQLAAFEVIKHGVGLAEVDRAARKVIEDAGYGPKFGHSLGHGIGLEVHEAPRLAADQKDQLKAGMVITIEPGIYLPGWGGVRLEDDVLVTKNGCEILTHVPTALEECVVV
jgi:Xaa-Pro aminopeptidase